MLDYDQFLVIVRNESLKPTSIPMGTVIAHLYITDVVTDAPSTDRAVSSVDPSLLDFVVSPIDKEGKERLSKKL